VASGEQSLLGSDLELARAAARGDAQSFHALIDRHSAEMFRLALSLSGRRADAEDICQEAFIGAYRGLPRFDGRSSFKTWLTRIVLRQSAKVWKKSVWRNTVSLDAQTGLDGASGPRVKEAHGSVSKTDIAMDLTDVIARLGPDHQQVIVLRELNGLSYDEIAEALDIPVGTVESRLYRARAELRKLLKDYEL
jgi:RNA polymerase sigma-70 factor (ECF subfamily)